MRALIPLLCWLALSGPLALLVSRLIGTAGGDDGVGDEAERWLRSLVPPRHRVRDAVLRSALAVIVLAPVAVAGLAAVWQLPDAVTVSRADGQLALSWPPGQPDETTTTTSAPAAADAPRGGTVAPTASAEPTVPEATPPGPAAEPAPPTGAGGGDTGAPAVAEGEPEVEPPGDDDGERCDDRSGDERSKRGNGDRCDDDSSGPGSGDEGDRGDDAPTTTTTTTEPPPPADDDEPQAMAPFRSSTALVTGVR